MLILREIFLAEPCGAKTTKAINSYVTGLPDAFECMRGATLCYFFRIRGALSVCDDSTNGQVHGKLAKGQRVLRREW